MIWNGLPVVIYGTGGISKEVYQLIKTINLQCKQKSYEIMGFISDDEVKIGEVIIEDTKVVASDENFNTYSSKFPILGAIIPIGNPKIKEIIYKKICCLDNVVFPNIIHPTVDFHFDVNQMGHGNILCSGVAITCNVNMGNFNLVNLNSTIGHDTIIGDYNVINPLVAISGNVKIGCKSLIGTGSKILQNLSIANLSTIGAGAVVVKSIEHENLTYVGIPAKPLI